jgi:hypothetical protein
MIRTILPALVLAAATPALAQPICPVPTGLINAPIAIDPVGNFVGCTTPVVPSLSTPGWIALALGMLAISAVASRRSARPSLA